MIRPSSQPGVISDAADKAAPRPPVKVLIVDDVPENLVALAALLRRDDVEVLRATSGREALALLLDHEVALAVIDVQMPEIDGFELAELMRGTERTKHVPILFVTAGSRDQARVFAGYEAGAVDFLFKPIEPHILTSKVNVFVTLCRQRQQLETKVAELNAALETNQLFVGILGHDLRAPLSVVEMTADVWGRRDDETSKRAAKRLSDASRRMTRMIRDLLDTARARRGGGMPVQLAPADFGIIVNSALSELEVATRGREVRLDVLGDTVGAWDADRLAQVVTNLVMNALQHGTHGTPVDVCVDGSAPDEIIFSVSNHGALTVKEDDLFNPFVTGRPHGGFGLGLYIVQLITQAHGGSVRARADGERTIFRATLPRARALDDAEREPADARTPA